MKHLLVSLIIALVPAALFAQDASGDVRITLDGREYVAGLDPAQSDWTAGSVSLYFRATHRDASEFFSVLTLGFSYYPPPGMGMDGSQLEILRFPDGGLERIGSDKEQDKGGLILEISKYDVEGDYLTVAGTLNGQMGPSQGFGRTIDLSEPIEVRGEFSVVVGSLE